MRHSKKMKFLRFVKILGYWQLYTWASEKMVQFLNKMGAKKSHLSIRAYKVHLQTLQTLVFECVYIRNFLFQVK